MRNPKSVATLTALLLAAAGACSSGAADSTRPGDTSAGERPVAEAGREIPSPTPARPADVAHVAPTATPDSGVVAAKRYLSMSETEKYEFVEQRARHVSVMISSGSYEFSEEAVRYIKQYVDVYARRVGNKSKASWGEDLNYVFARARGYAPVIIRSFNERHVPPAIGLYLVAVETEYTNPSRENSAGAAGLFQFIGPTAELYGVHPGERTDVRKMAPAAARYMADRILEFGTDPMSVALGIAAYNRDPDSVRNDLRSVMNSENKERSFWTLVANSNKLDHYFRGENVKYVPKFFAAAIVGETPWAFGLEMDQALSTYTETDAAPPPPAPAGRRSRR